MMYTDEPQSLSKVNATTYLRDYLEFGIKNGIISIDAYLADWDKTSLMEKKIRMAKVLAEYGRCLEEFFVYLYALAGVAERDILDREIDQEELDGETGPEESDGETKLKENVFLERLVYYRFPDLDTFIDSLSKSDIRELLILEEPSLVAHELGTTIERIETELSTIPERLNIFKEQHTGEVHDLYNKLKHPFLVFSTVPKEIGDENSFAIFQDSADRKTTHFNFTPIELSLDTIMILRENAKNAYALLEFLIRYFIASSDIRNR